MGRADIYSFGCASLSCRHYFSVPPTSHLDAPAACCDYLLSCSSSFPCVLPIKQHSSAQAGRQNSVLVWHDMRAGVAEGFYKASRRFPGCAHIFYYLYQFLRRQPPSCVARETTFPSSPELLNMVIFTCHSHGRQGRLNFVVLRLKLWWRASGAWRRAGTGAARCPREDRKAF